MRRLTLHHVVIAAVAFAGALATSGPIVDNSTMSHLRSGLDMFHSGAIPRHDPYSFTAPGEPWVVQSWFAEWIYGALRAFGGLKLFIFGQMLLSAAIATVMTLLARTRSLFGTLVASIISVTMVFPYLAQRPLLFGLLCFALVILVIERKYSWVWLLPIMWVWVNAHGSFPIVFAWLGAVIVGAWLDNRRVDRQLSRYLGAASAGVVLAALNPLGLKLLVFWTTALGERRDVFAKVAEWQAPSFRGPAGLTFLVLVIVAGGILAATKPKWRDIVPVLLFLAATFSARNVPLLAIVLCPVLGRSLGSVGASWRHAQVEPPRQLVIAALVVLLPAVLVTVVRVVDRDPVDDGPYPVAAFDWMRGEHLLEAPHRVAARDFVGCYRIFTNQEGNGVFFDDRFDMYPAQVSRDHYILLEATSPVIPVLDKYDIDVVVWEKDRPLTQVLMEKKGWDNVWSDDTWVVFRRS